MAYLGIRPGDLDGKPYAPYWNPKRLPFDGGHLIHLMQEEDGGCVMRSRFWIGDVAVRSLAADHPVHRISLRNRFVARAAAAGSIGRDLVVHCAAEMAHLARFLPALYADYHGD